MVHRLSRINGFHVHAKDGSIGHIDDFLVDSALGRLCYVVVDTSNWMGGRWVALSPSAITRVEWADREVHVTMTREEIRQGPSMEEVNVPSHELTPGFIIM